MTSKGDISLSFFFSHDVLTKTQVQSFHCRYTSDQCHIGHRQAGTSSCLRQLHDACRTVTSATIINPEDIANMQILMWGERGKIIYLNTVRRKLTIMNLHMVCNHFNSLYSCLPTMFALICKKRFYSCTA